VISCHLSEAITRASSALRDRLLHRANELLERQAESVAKYPQPITSIRRSPRSYLETNV
jgi:hypothetical protein